MQVRHPGVGRAISRDFELMMAAASVAEFLPSMRRLRIRESLKQFAAPLQEQVQDGRRCLLADAKKSNMSGGMSHPIRAADV